MKPKQEASPHRVLRYIILSFVIIFGFISIIGTGGGGGGGGGGDGGGGITYTGLTTQAQITDTNAELFAAGALGAGRTGTIFSDMGAVEKSSNVNISGFTAFSISQTLKDAVFQIDLSSITSPPFIGATQSGTEPGPCGGSVSYSMQVNETTGVFSGTFTFKSYCDSDVVITGSTNVNGTINLGTMNIENIQFHFENLSDGSSTLRGDLDMDFTVDPIRVDFDTYLKDNATGTVYWASNYVMNITDAGYYVDVEIISGDYYEPDYGYVIVSTQTPFTIYNGDEWPTDGVLVVEGSKGMAGGSTMARLTALTSSSYKIEADTDGNGSFEYDFGALPWSGSDNIPPSSPENLDAIAISSSQINLSWNASIDNIGVTGYKIYKDGSYLKSVTSTSTSDTGLSESTQYCYTISAYDAAGNESNHSNESCATTQPPPSPGVIVGRGAWSDGNGHEYVVVSFPVEIWDNAVTDLNTLIPGYHLATITSQEENDFVLNLLTSLNAYGQYWLGGFQDPINEPIDDKGWIWVTSEPWDYTNWRDSEPNGGIVENHLAMEGSGEWNDEGSAIGAISGYIAEE